MAVVSLSSGDITCTIEELHELAKINNFSIKPGSGNESTFHTLANSFDALCETIYNLPEFEDPRAAPCKVQGERKYYRPVEKDNPLNAWMHRTDLKSSDVDAAKGPLAGKTIAIKDNMSVAGLPLGLGTSASLFKGGKPPTSPIDATVVRRVLEAGATIKGTATCENLSIFPLSYTSDAGAVHNAWLPGYATGGSSSGCGALVSIGDVLQARKDGRDRRDYPVGESVDLAIGGDQGGSVRLPAAFSGIYGLKPTHGLVPYTGIASLHPLVDSAGPMARSVEDVALLLGVLAGYDGMDCRMSPESPLRSQVPDYLGDLKSWIAEKQSRNEWNASSSAKGLKIGILKEAFETRLDPSVRSTLQSAIERFKALGADVEEVSIPLHAHGAALWSVALRPHISHFLAAKPTDLLSHPMPHLDLLPMNQNFYDMLANRNAAPLNMVMNASRMEEKYGNHLARKAYMHIFELRAAYDAAFEDHGLDVLLTPMTPCVGPKIPQGALRTEENPRGLSEKMMDIFEPSIGVTVNTAPFNISGHPGMSIPIGWGKVAEGEGRLPVGMQIVARRWDEGSIFKAAKAWEVGGSWMDIGGV